MNEEILRYLMNELKLSRENILSTPGLCNCIEALEAAGAFLQKHPEIYKAVANGIRHSTVTRISEAMAALKRIGVFPISKSPELYLTVIEEVPPTENFLQGFEALRNSGASLQDHFQLYKALIKNTWTAHIFHQECFGYLDSAFTALKNTGANFQDHLQLYMALAEKLEVAKKIPEYLSTLVTAGAVPLSKYLELYITVIKEAPTIDQFRQCFTELTNAGITLLEHPQLYIAAIKKARNVSKFSTCLDILIKAGAVPVSKYFELYVSIIEYSGNIDEIHKGFEALEEVGATLNDYPQLYADIINSNRYSWAAHQGFETLKEVGASLETHPQLFAAMVKQIGYSKQISKGFASLTEIRASLARHPQLFLYMIQNAEYCREITEGIDGLKQVTTLDEHEQLYEELMTHAKDAGKLGQGFAALIRINASPETHEHLYEYIKENTSNADKLDECFECLKKLGATLGTYPQLFEAMIKNVCYASVLRQGQQTFHDASNGSEFKLEFLGEDTKVASIISALNSLQALDVKASSVPGLNYIITALHFPEETKLRLDKLLGLGFDFISHASVYNTFLSGGDILAISKYHFSKIILKFDSYLKANKLLCPTDKGYKTQCDKIIEIITKEVDEDSKITLGPLNKSIETIKLEEILHKIATMSIDKINIHYDEKFGYILVLDGERPYYLSLLLNQTNFSHVELTEKEIQALGDKINAATEDVTNKEKTFKTTPPYEEDFIVSQLPEAVKKALNCYIHDNRHKNMNRLFRGESLTEKQQYQWVTPTHGKMNLLANFLCGCLVNWSGAELPRLLHDSEEKQFLDNVLLEKILGGKKESLEEYRSKELYCKLLSDGLSGHKITQDEHDKLRALHHKLDIFYPRPCGFLDRGEDLEEARKEGELAIIERRVANPTRLWSATSFSAFEAGSGFFHQKCMTITALETNSLEYVFNNKQLNEREVLVPHGSAVLKYTYNDNKFFAKKVEGLEAMPQEGYYTSLALAEAYQNRLMHPYKEEESIVTIDGKVINRPNHGLAHAYRGMLLIPVVINYFACHSNDEAFKKFCQTMTPTEQEWLKVAAAYANTGRENEMGAAGNRGRYDEMRVVCLKNLQDFFAKYPPESFLPKTPDTKKMQKSIEHILRYMGNPGYEKEFDGKPEINQHQDLDERNHRNFLNRILTIAHKIDLLRCYKPAEFEHAMSLCLELSEKSVEQKIDYECMIRYTKDLMQAHGNMLTTDLSDSGYTINHQRYRSPFGIVSTSLHHLEAISRSVPQPSFADNHVEVRPRC